MKFTKAGIILFTEKYEECVNFYGKVLGLKTLHEIDRPGERLTTFSLGDTYLMVESGGVACASSKTAQTCPTKFRFNVSDVEATCNELRSRNLDTEIVVHSWGMTAEFCDPDGNRCALRTDKGFGD
jgi:lactoylglutathione lyase